MDTIFEKYGKILQSNPLFKDISPDEIPVMLDRLKAYTKSYKKDEFIRHSGDSADFIGIVLAGEIQVLQDDYYGNRSITAFIAEGSLFGEAFACAGIKQLPVDIMAAGNCTIMYLNSNAVFSGCDSRCQFHYTLIKNLLGIIAGKSIYLNQKLKYISQKTTAGKLLAYLNDRAKQNGTNEFVIPFNRQELADYLGVERSAMSAEISRLVRMGVLETRRSYFKLLKPNALK